MTLNELAFSCTGWALVQKTWTMGMTEEIILYICTE